MEPSHNYGMEGSITTWYLRVFLIGSRYYNVFIRGSDTINGVSGRFRYVLPYLRVFLEGSRSYNVIMGGFHPGASGVIRSPYQQWNTGRRIAFFSKAAGHGFSPYFLGSGKGAPSWYNPDASLKSPGRINRFSALRKASSICLACLLPGPQ